MKKKYFLMFLITSTIFGQDLQEVTPLLSKGDLFLEFDQYNDFIEKEKIYKIRDNKIIIETFENEISSDTIVLDTELDIYDIKVSKTDNIYVSNKGQNYLVDNNKLIAIENYNDEEFTIQNEIQGNATFSESEIESLNVFFELHGNYNTEHFGKKIYESNDTRLLICYTQPLGDYYVDRFLFKINKNGIAELLYTASEWCQDGVWCKGEDFFSLDDVLYILKINYEDAPTVVLYKIEGNISTNFTLSNPIIPSVKGASIYVIENGNIRIINNNYSISTYNLQGQKSENSNLSSNQIYVLKITNITTQQTYIDKIIVQ